ncbi:adhesive plaque matrix 2-like isoform X7, partial [Paramuricea clavata]
FPCASYPCLNGGNCSDNATSFSCSCPYRYSGYRCQIDECPPESDTEITIFISLKYQVTIQISDTVTFTVRIKIVEIFVVDLQNKLSAAFRNLRSIFLELFIRIFRILRSFLGIFFNSFSAGGVDCVVAYIEILFNSTEPIPTVDEVQSRIVEARDNGSAPFNISSLQVAKKGFPCASYPCMNGGNCSENGTLFSCLCPEGYTGQLCEMPIPPCASNPCMNGGNCSENGTSFSCQCPDGYTGQLCEMQ